MEAVKLLFLIAILLAVIGGSAWLNYELAERTTELSDRIDALPEKVLEMARDEQKDAIKPLEEKVKSVEKVAAGAAARPKVIVVQPPPEATVPMTPIHTPTPKRSFAPFGKVR